MRIRESSQLRPIKGSSPPPSLLLITLHTAQNIHHHLPNHTAHSQYLSSQVDSGQNSQSRIRPKAGHRRIWVKDLKALIRWLIKKWMGPGRGGVRGSSRVCFTVKQQAAWPADRLCHFSIRDRQISPRQRSWMQASICMCISEERRGCLLPPDLSVPYCLFSSRFSHSRTSLA